MSPVAPVSDAVAASGSPGVSLPDGAAVGLAVALLPFVPLWLAPVVDYDVGTVRAAVTLGELVVVMAVWRGGVLADAWRGIGRGARLLAGVWGLAMLVTTVAALHPAPAVLRTVEWGGHLLFGVAMWAWSRDAPERATRLAACAAAGFLGVSAMAAFGWCRSAWAGQPVEAIADPLSNVRYVGFYAMSALTLGLAAMPRRAPGRPAAIGWSAAWTLGWMVLCWSGGRGAIGATLAAVAVWALVTRPDRRRVGMLALAAALGALASLGLPGDGRTMGLARFLTDVLPGGANYSANRTVVWAFLLDLWSARPVLGLGPDGAAFPLVDHTHAHNTVVQALVEWGAVGAAAFVALLVAMTVRVVRRARHADRSPATGAALALWTAFLLNGLLDGLFYGAATLALAALVPALVVAPPTRSVRHARPVRCLALGLALSALAAVPAAHLASSAARFAAGSPAPDSVQARLALGVPTSYRQTEILWWGKDWARSHPADALHAARWGQSHSRTPWAFVALEGDLRAAAGDASGAETLWLRAAAAREASFDPHRTP